jgi:hypothetical protein
MAGDYLVWASTMFIPGRRVPFRLIRTSMTIMTIERLKGLRNVVIKCTFKMEVPHLQYLTDLFQNQNKTSLSLLLPPLLSFINAYPHLRCYITLAEE